MSSIKKTTVGLLAPIILIFFILIIIIGAAIGLLQGQGQTSDCDGSGSTYQIGNINGNTTTANIVNNEKIVWNYLKSQGWSTAGACALMGRIMDESTFNPNATDSSGHHGIAQWDASNRWPKAEAWIKAHGHDPNSIEGQIMYEVYEMQTSYPKVYKDVKDSNNAISAVNEISKDYEGGIAGNSVQYTKAIEASFGSGNDKTTQGTNNFTAADGQMGNSNSCDLGSSGGNGDVLGTAKKLIGYFTYSQPNRRDVTKNGKSLNSLNSIDDINKNGQTDCSGFVWLVLKLAGYKVPANMGWYTGTMAADARGSHHWLKQVDAKDAKAGDVVIVNDGSGEGGNGHTAILMENWHGNSTKVIEMGGLYSETHVNAGHTFQESFLSLLDGGDICFAKPIK